MSVHLDGYGSSIEFDGEHVTLIAGRVEARLLWAAWNTDRFTFPLDDVLEIDYRHATALINGSLSFTTRHPAYAYANGGEFSIAPDDALVIKWRKKDQDGFGALYESLPVRRLEPESRKALLSDRTAERNADLHRHVAENHPEAAAREAKRQDAKKLKKAPSVSARPDGMEQLLKLGQLRDAGVLTDEEFTAKKAELLERL